MCWDKDEAETLRQMIRHESEVINARLSYLMTLQGLLFAALGFAWASAANLIVLLSSAENATTRLSLRRSRTVEASTLEAGKVSEVKTGLIGGVMSRTPLAHVK